MMCTTAAPQSTMIHSPLSSPSVRSTGKPARLDRVAHAGGQRLGLPVAGARGDDHALEQRRQVLGVEDDDVLGLHVFEAIDDGALQFADVHSAPGGRPGRDGTGGAVNIARHRRRAPARSIGPPARRRARGSSVDDDRPACGSGSDRGAARPSTLRVRRGAAPRARAATASVTPRQQLAPVVPGVQAGVLVLADDQEPLRARARAACSSRTVSSV